MQEESAIRTARPRWRGFVPAVIIGSVVIAGSLLGSGVSAFFTDTASVGANTFTDGTVDLTTSPASAAISYSAMAPGDTVTNPVTVANAGTLTMRYALSSVATNADSKGLKDQLALTIKTEDAGGGCSAFTGTSLYSGDLDSTAGKLIGDSTTGSQAGDRTLTAGSSEVLCLRATLPSGTGNAFQGAATTATFSFDAEQTKNN
jgi:predicted ribosomally synthesized peptide with SipW-like signal peptide